MSARPRRFSKKPEKLSVAKIQRFLPKTLLWKSSEQLLVFEQRKLENKHPLQHKQKSEQLLAFLLSAVSALSLASPK
jgi:hypothetical protein